MTDASRRPRSICPLYVRRVSHDGNASRMHRKRRSRLIALRCVEMVHSGLFQAVVSASNVEVWSYECLYASYVSVPGLRWRETRLRRLTGATGARRKSYTHPMRVARERG